MVIKLGNFEFSEVWDGVFYKKLSCYPQVTDWAIRNLLEIMEYEKRHGREYTIECEDKVLYIQNDCRDIWEWSEKLYCAIEDRKTAGT